MVHCRIDLHRTLTSVVLQDTYHSHANGGFDVEQVVVANHNGLVCVHSKIEQRAFEYLEVGLSKSNFTRRNHVMEYFVQSSDNVVILFMVL